MHWIKKSTNKRKEVSQLVQLSERKVKCEGHSCEKENIWIIHKLTEINDSRYFLKELDKLVIEYPDVEVSLIKQI